ncbi:SGNH/GDSL hydrolase family protein [Mycobacterium simiae]|uniref:SGNH/GDSL hydrolase family protein n=1 Tax=Mycobacterium simiae TaxID=1784 RepID=A0A5B1BTS0_MYCSI|nr:GDSL lipase [Mycobacterium simiae]KAA1252107.1 SGNH/GDSL hydrolase family protein [Mycobacterium simiae]
MSRLATFVVGLTLLVDAASGFPAYRAYRPLTTDFRLVHLAVIGDSYTTGTDEGGLGPKSWPARAWQTLAQEGERIAADVAAEGRAGYAVSGDHGSIFEDLTATAVKLDDVLVVFFGSRNDQGVDPGLLAERVRTTFDLARRLAPSARFLVIGPPWPTADVPDSVLQIRDVLNAAAGSAGAVFVDPIDAQWFVDRPELIGADGVHPNDAGHAYLADTIAPLIRAQL